MTAPAATIGPAIAATDFLRQTSASYSPERGYKEWLHFAIHAGPISALLNFSMSDAMGDNARRGARIGRLTCLVRDDHWDGDVDTYAGDSVSARGGAIQMRLGECSAVFENGVFKLKASLARRPISLDLTLRPEALPSESNNVFFDDCPPMSWVVVPRLRASGFIRLGAELHELHDAPAYHDHNWGHFRWGKNFAWEWGYGLPERAGDRWSLVFVRFMDRPRVSDLMRGLLVWRGARQAKIFRGNEVTMKYEGFLRKRDILKLPRPLSLVAPSVATDLPERVMVSAVSGDDRLEAVFEVEDYAQLIVPNDDDLGVTLINEVVGRIAAEGRVGSERVTMSGPSTFEFLNE